MSKCPYCSQNIDTLRCVELAQVSYKVSYESKLATNGKLYTIHYEKDPDTTLTNNMKFYCTHCGALIAKDEDTAIKFLKGEKVRITKDKYLYPRW